MFFSSSVWSYFGGGGCGYVRVVRGVCEGMCEGGEGK